MEKHSFKLWGVVLKAVDVVVGIIFDKGKFLVERRKKDEDIDPGIICLPSGHVKRNETKEKALIREMKEELDIKVKKSEFFKKDFWIASNGENQNLYYYLILDYNGKPFCKTAKELLWSNKPEDLDTNVDRRAIEKVLIEKDITHS